MTEVVLHDCFEPRGLGATALGDDEVHVWAVPLVGDGGRHAELLSREELAAAERYRFVDHRRRYAIAHGALRAILGGYGAGDPRALEFELGQRKKPRLRGRTDLEFNLSHSGQLALVAVGRAALGIDVEKMRHIESLRDIARNNFSAAENRALEACCDADRLRGFYRCWTRKEAYVKALGTGLSAALDAFDVSIGGEAALLALRDGEDVARWALFDVSPGPDYAAALAVRRASARPSTFRLA